MRHHTLTPPVEFKDALDHWTVTGASIIETSKVLLHPAIPKRMGFVFSRKPLLTNNFEATFQFRITGDKEPHPMGQGVAFWYVQDNVSSFNETRLIKAPDWEAGMEQEGLTFLGSKGKFTGFGAVLTPYDATGQAAPTIGYVTSDGSTTLSLKDAMSKGPGSKADFRNSVNPASLRLRVRPDSVLAEWKETPSLSWKQAFKVDRSSDKVKSGGYLGITAWSGSNPGADMVALTSIKVEIFDDTSIGEEMSDVSVKIQEAYKEMLMDKNRHFIDQKSQTEHLARLTTLLSQHISEASQQEQNMFTALEGSQHRLRRLDEEVVNLRKAIAILVNPGEDNPVGTMREDIIGLRRLLIKDNADHRQKLDSVHKNVVEVKNTREKSSNPEALNQIARQTESMEQTVKARSTQMSWLVLVFLLCVAIIGYLIWNRMQYYEKKHFI